MHEIAKSSSVAFSILILSTAGFPKVCDRGKLRVQRTAYVGSIGMISESGRQGDGKVHTCVPAVIQIIDGSLCLGFPFISRIYVANEVVPNVVAHLGRSASVNGKS